MGRRREAVIRQKAPGMKRGKSRHLPDPLGVSAFVCGSDGRVRYFAVRFASIFVPRLQSPDDLRAHPALAQRFRPRPARISPPVRGCFIAYCALNIALALF